MSTGKNSYFNCYNRSFEPQFVAGSQLFTKPHDFLQNTSDYRNSGLTNQDYFRETLVIDFGYPLVNVYIAMENHHFLAG
jgi:hypothetical protein